MIDKKLSEDMLYKMDAYWRAANYLSCAQIYLKDNPLLKRKLEFDDVKSKLVGHWGTVPGQNFIYVHLNRVIKKYDLNMIYINELFNKSNKDIIIVTSTLYEANKLYEILKYYNSTCHYTKKVIEN